MGRVKSRDLVLVNLRLRKKDVAEARREAQRLSIPYQHVIRGWVSEGADASLARRTKG